MNKRIQELAEQARENLMEDSWCYTDPREPLQDRRQHPKYTHQQKFEEKFAELIVRECVAQCGSQADRKSILIQFGLPVESNIKYSGPDAHWSVTSQYSREYNMPEQSKD